MDEVADIARRAGIRMIEEILRPEDYSDLEYNTKIKMVQAIKKLGLPLVNVLVDITDDRIEYSLEFESELPVSAVVTLANVKLIYPTTEIKASHRGTIFMDTVRSRQKEITPPSS